MSSHATQIAFALVVLIPLTLFIGSRIGEGVPFLAAIITAAIAGFLVPRVPGSPVACLDQHPASRNPCAQHMTWVWALNILTPLGIAIFWGMIRDRRRRGRR